MTRGLVVTSGSTGVVGGGDGEEKREGVRVGRQFGVEKYKFRFYQVFCEGNIHGWFDMTQTRERQGWIGDFGLEPLETKYV